MEIIENIKAFDLSASGGLMQNSGINLRSAQFFMAADGG
jgi:hypothetical protein